MVMKKPTLPEWAETITDNQLHHIGEYFCLVTGNQKFYKYTGGPTKAFCAWMISSGTFDNPLPKEILEKFEVLRDMNVGFFIRRKP